jgi:hypothetical protein
MAQSIRVEKLTLKEMMFRPSYYDLADDLSTLPTPETIRFDKKNYPVPQTFDDFSKVLCYGQRMFLPRKEENDFGAIIRIIDGYYFPLVTGEKWDEERAIVFGKKVINCRVIELYPVAMQLITFTADLLEREYTLLHREPSKVEKAAGIESLNKYSDLSALNFLRDTMKITTEEVILTPYNECLVRFMLHKDTEEFRERLFDLQKAEAEAKQKKPHHGN